MEAPCLCTGGRKTYGEAPLRGFWGCPTSSIQNGGTQLTCWRDARPLQQPDEGCGLPIPHTQTKAPTHTKPRQLPGAHGSLKAADTKLNVGAPHYCVLMCLELQVKPITLQVGCDGSFESNECSFCQSFQEEVDPEGGTKGRKHPRLRKRFSLILVGCWPEASGV